MKMRKLFAGLAAAATLLSGMAIGVAAAQADDAPCCKLTTHRKAIRTRHTSLPRSRILAMARSK